MVKTDEEIEADRQSYLATENSPEPYELGSNGYHEALDRSSIALNLVDRELLYHPAIVYDAENFRLAQRAFDNLWDLYQVLGRKHLADPE